MNRRIFLTHLASFLLYASFPTRLCLSSNHSLKQSAIPVCMFHRVNDTPKFPEEVRSKELKDFFTYTWSNGYYPINVGDILERRVDSVVPQGLKPLVITIDDASPSVFFSKKDTKLHALKNEYSFMNILIDSCRQFNFEPRITIFMSSCDYKKLGLEDVYFGGIMPLKQIIEPTISRYSGVEFGYHTHKHPIMRDMNYGQTKDLLQNQMHVFKKEGVIDSVVPIFAYPYGVPPQADGIEALKDLGFSGAVLASSGVSEAVYTTMPQCLYSYKDGLSIDRFRIPRMSIGSYRYSYIIKSKQFTPITPIDGFKKNYEYQIIPYVSRGKSLL